MVIVCLTLISSNSLGCSLFPQVWDFVVGLFEFYSLLGKSVCTLISRYTTMKWYALQCDFHKYFAQYISQPWEFTILKWLHTASVSVWCLLPDYSLSYKLRDGLNELPLLIIMCKSFFTFFDSLGVCWKKLSRTSQLRYIFSHFDFQDTIYYITPATQFLTVFVADQSI